MLGLTAEEFIFENEALDTGIIDIRKNATTHAKGFCIRIFEYEFARGNVRRRAEVCSEVSPSALMMLDVLCCTHVLSKPGGNWMEAF